MATIEAVTHLLYWMSTVSLGLSFSVFYFPSLSVSIDLTLSIHLYFDISYLMKYWNIVKEQRLISGFPIFSSAVLRSCKFSEILFSDWLDCHHGCNLSSKPSTVPNNFYWEHYTDPQAIQKSENRL